MVKLTYGVLYALDGQRPHEAQHEDGQALAGRRDHLWEERLGEIRRVLDQRYGGYNALREDERPYADVHLNDMSTPGTYTEKGTTHQRHTIRLALREHPRKHAKIDSEDG